MYLLRAEEMQNLDRTAIKDLGIPGVVLMENAGLQVMKGILEVLGEVRGKTVTIFAGKGNNGGDGFVVARHLLNAGAEVKVMLFADLVDIAGDAKVNLNILQSMGYKVYPIINPNSLNIVKLAMVYSDLIVDAIFGTGFKGAVSGHVGNVIEIINSSGKPVVSVDIPSGLEANTGAVHGPCIKANRTITFAYAKLGLLIGHGPEYAGELTVADISIPPDLIRSMGINRFLITSSLVREIMPVRKPDGHKGTYGRILVVGGSDGMSGAAAMAATAALKAGAGLVTLAVPASLHDLMEVKLTEIMTKPLPETEETGISRDALPYVRGILERMDVLAVGPGMSTGESTFEFVRQLVAGLEKPAVIDADGLNALAGNVDVLKSSGVSPVLTPHPGEMARLMGIKTEEVQNNRVETASEAAKNWNAVVVLKGHRTVVADPGGAIYINPTGNPGMASGGTGDVLTGIIAGLLGQRLSPLEAAVAGVYFHGLSGDLAAAQKGMISLVAGDLLDYLPQATRDFC
ncbi:MAG: bifunctional ADP-dependent NAD(P)H-hydrate dehydratase/NAD(P)H-hydrate epimerase [Firmicutes bacterium HGW-Firmicutes-14]|nr:MAG: bifunctional ADP-dependent NAD(P)H-hydrate dehydratase/NAD(P)H-hydrate epimerase [Firmicutes bacterium HGW-Firmicutes-14]